MELLIPSDEMNQFVLSYCKKSPGNILSPLLDMFIKASVFSIDLLTEKLVGLIDQKQLCSKLSNLTICNEFLRRVDILKRTNASGQDVSVYNAVIMSYQQTHCKGHQNVSCDVVAKTSSKSTLQNKKRKCSSYSDQTERAPRHPMPCDLLDTAKPGINGSDAPAIFIGACGANGSFSRFQQ